VYGKSTGSLFGCICRHAGFTDDLVKRDIYAFLSSLSSFYCEILQLFIDFMLHCIRSYWVAELSDVRVHWRTSVITICPVLKVDRKTRCHYLLHFLYPVHNPCPIAVCVGMWYDPWKKNLRAILNGHIWVSGCTFMVAWLYFVSRNVEIVAFTVHISYTPQAHLASWYTKDVSWYSVLASASSLLPVYMLQY